MSEPQEPPRAKLIASLIYADPGACAHARRSLTRRTGPEDYVSPEFPFDRTSYYAKEMGAGLRRVFVSYSPLILRDELPDIKTFAHTVEVDTVREGNRTVNIDPGYITPENLILSTFKGFSHRLYLGRGVFAEVTLIYEHGGFRPLRWTYPDYASPEVVEIMNGIRARYLGRLRDRGASRAAADTQTTERSHLI